MPFVCNSNETQVYPNKRRKLDSHLQPSSAMARLKEDSMDEEQRQPTQGLPYRSEEREQRRRVEYPGEVVRTSSREELMECIKRGQRPKWVPNPAFQALRDEEDALIALRRTKGGCTESSMQEAERAESPSTSVLSQENEHLQPTHEQSQSPLERPRSALHTGDFSEVDSDTLSDPWTNTVFQPGLAISTSEVSASPPDWLSGSPRPNTFNAMSHMRGLQNFNTEVAVANRRRAPSLGSSLSSSYMMRAPTSPLVHSTSNIDPSSSEAEQETPRRDHTRRRTMPPSSFHSFSMIPIDATPPNFSRPFAQQLRREASLPTQAHTSRHSLSSFTYHPRSVPQTPLGRSRGLSMNSKSSSRRRQSMVGSFEESILRGRMSTAPSKPLDFVAQIGVMGKGDCPASLKCPAHVSVPFPAVFYSYPTPPGAESFSNEAPSPYVGTVDLNRHLKPVVLSAKRSKRDAAVAGRQASSNLSQVQVEEHLSSTDASKLHVGGAYRVPQQGQLQIMIKNPNKTAVKLFLIPYDLSGMEVGTKTFVRQRSFSTGPIIDSMQGSTSATAAMADPLRNKHILRYLVHLKFCCPAKNRVYLYDNIRVVFANRVPDGKEKLRNELQQPEPTFSPWKPSKPEQASKALKSAPSTPTANTFEFESPQFFGDMEGFPEVHTPASPTPLPSSRPRSTAPLTGFPFPPSATNATAWSRSSHNIQMQEPAFEFPDIKRLQGPAETKKHDRPLSPVTGFSNTTPLSRSPILWKSSSSGGTSVRSFSPIPTEARDSLLSKQFKELNGQSNSSRATPSPEPRKVEAGEGRRSEEHLGNQSN